MKALRSISAVILATLVLVSSTNFVVGMHFCMGEIRNIALLTTADGCENEKNLPACHRHIKAPCCEDQTVIHKGDDLKVSASEIQIFAPEHIDIELPLVVISEVIPSAPLSRIHYYDYDPPLRTWDLTVDHQVFLI